MAFEGKIIRRIKDGENNTVCVFLATETMKKNYLELGEVINFDSTNRMIKRVSPYMSKYSVGYWVAQDSNLRLAIVGMCFFIENESELIKQVFLYFFELVCGTVLPLVIFTEKSEMIAKVL